VDGVSFEEQVNSLVKNIFRPNGLEVERWTKLPYLCEGDLELSFYWLFDAVFVLKINDNETEESASNEVHIDLGRINEGDNL